MLGLKERLAWLDPNFPQLTEYQNCNQVPRFPMPCSEFVLNDTFSKLLISIKISIKYGRFYYSKSYFSQDLRWCNWVLLIFIILWSFNFIHKLHKCFWHILQFVMAIMRNTKHMFVWRNLILLSYQTNCTYAVLLDFFFTKSSLCRNSITKKQGKDFRREELCFDSCLKRGKRL